MCRWKCVAPSVFNRRSKSVDASSGPSSTATATDSATRSSFHGRRLPPGGRAAVAAPCPPSPTTSPRPRRAGGAVARSPGQPSGHARTVDRSESSGLPSASAVRVDGRRTDENASRSSRSARAPLSHSTDRHYPGRTHNVSSTRNLASKTTGEVNSEQMKIVDLCTHALFFLHLKRFNVASSSQARGNHYSTGGQGQKSPVRLNRCISFFDPNVKF